MIRRAATVSAAAIIAVTVSVSAAKIARNDILETRVGWVNGYCDAITAISEKVDTKQVEGTEFWSPFYGYRVKITDSLLVLFTLLLFFATLALWLSTRRLVNNADDTARAQLRAYVGIDEIKLDMPNLSNRKYEIPSPAPPGLI
jgi:hypothetical protein